MAPAFLRSKKAIWLFGGVLLLIAICVAPIRPTNLTEGNGAWTTQGCFQAGGVYPTTRFDKRIAVRDRRELRLWGSWCGGDASTGTLTSPVFEAPGILELAIAGYASNPGLAMFLEREDGRGRFPLAVGRQPAETWTIFHWWIPGELRGRRVRLVAVDEATGLGGWLGLSNPRGLSLLGLFRWQMRPCLMPVLIFLAQLALFLAPGFVLAAWLAGRRSIGPISLLIVVIATGATLGYAAFWAFFFSKLAGRILCYGVYAATASALLLPGVRRRAAWAATARQVAEPLVWTTLAGLCYLGFFFLFTDPYTPGAFFAGDRFFVEIRPGDNVIPHIFAEKIYAREPLRPFCCGDWLSSDRPPLQAGIVLLERPLPLMKHPELRYELLSSALECFWICGVWCVLKALGTPVARSRQVLGFLIFSGFLFYNSVYTWPKLLAACCLLFVLATVFDAVRRQRPTSYLEGGLAAVCLGLALMSHPGSAFSLVGIALPALWFRRLFPWRQIGMAAAIVAVFYVPWSAYQKYVDPPGNRLLKIHLAGVVPVDSRSTWQSLKDSYGSHPFSEILHFKWLNVTFMGGQKFFDSYGLEDVSARGGLHIDTAATEVARIAQRDWIWNAVGLANAGWLAIPLVLLLGRGKRAAVPFAGWVIAVAVFNLIFWSFITFGPNETVTTHSSYTDILLLSVGLLGFVLTLPRWVYGLLLGWQIFNFLVVWVWSLPARIGQPVVMQLPMLAVAGMAMAGLVWFTWRRAEDILPEGA